MEKSARELFLLSLHRFTNWHNCQGIQKIFEMQSK